MQIGSPPSRTNLLKISEASFTSAILAWAKNYGWHRFHVRNSGYAGISYVQGDRGFPDLILLRSPRVIVAELKTARGKRGELKPEQTEWLRLWGKVPTVETYEWRPQDWTEIVRTLMP